MTTRYVDNQPMFAPQFNRSTPSTQSVRFENTSPRNVQPLQPFTSPVNEDDRFGRGAFSMYSSASTSREDPYLRRSEYISSRIAPLSSTVQNAAQPAKQKQAQSEESVGSMVDDEPPTSALLDDVASIFSRRTTLEDTNSTLQNNIQQTKKRDMFATPDEDSESNSSPLSKLRRKSEQVTINTLQSPTHTDPFYEQPTLTESATADNEWVTVFGFPPSQASFILNQFAQYGKIVDHKAENGNWMHIRYDSKFLAQKALSKNGMIFDNVLMIGVVECLDPAALNRPKQHSRLIRRPKDMSRKEPLAPLSKVTGQKRAYEAIQESTEEREAKKSKPSPSNSFLSQIIDRIFKF